MLATGLLAVSGQEADPFLGPGIVEVVIAHPQVQEIKIVDLSQLIFA